MKLLILLLLSFSVLGAQGNSDYDNGLNQTQQNDENNNFYEDAEEYNKNIVDSSENTVSDFDADKDPIIQEIMGWNEGEYLFVMTHNVYIRKGPGLFYPTVKKLNHNQKVKVLGKRKGGWVLVSHGGWVPYKSLDIRRYEKPQKYRESLTTIVQLVSVKVYGGPGFHYPVVSKRMKGDRVRIIRNHGPWAQIGASQYVLRGLIDGRKTR
ncbi:MAG: SH3 domain-containing protein [Oligoflexales bacterium]